MCGIVGYVGPKDALPIVISGLRKLEYRGYDSAGVAMVEGNKIVVTRAQGKLAVLEAELEKREGRSISHLGLGHTRWATHGKPSERNAHPHSAGRVSLIHNGIIENYISLREKLLKEGSNFSSETDTEIAAHLFNSELNKGSAPIDAFKSMCSQIKGSYAILAIDEQTKDKIFVAKTATPIVIGIGEGESIVASDIPAVLDYTKKVIILEDGDIAEVTANEIKIYNNNKLIEREIRIISWDPITAQKGGYEHYMLKEIHEQVIAVSETLRGRLEDDYRRIDLSEFGLKAADIKKIRRIVMVACGTAWHACLTAKFLIEQVARIPCEVDYASEFRYREPILDGDTLVLAISQSGETADTVAAIEIAAKKANTIAICNVLGSTLTRKVSHTLYTHAGPEISVASTKAFTTQLTAAYLLAIYLGQERGILSPEVVASFVEDIVKAPSAIDEALKLDSEIKEISQKYFRARDFLFLGRGVLYPIALEGALKLKEISYIHAEGYPAGEIKHGPISLIDESMPVVVLLPRDEELYAKSLSNLREVESRGGKIIAITDSERPDEVRQYASDTIVVPYVSHLLTPLVMTIPLQFLAYYVAVYNGTDVDLPRNLAKSVTVE